MDNLKRLELEYEGIRGTILDYTSEGNIVNFLDGLKKQIDIKDIEVKVGDIVTLIGDKVTADLVADFARSASYELLCRLGTRVHRIYKYEKITEWI